MTMWHLALISLNMYWERLPHLQIHLYISVEINLIFFCYFWIHNCPQKWHVIRKSIYMFINKKLERNWFILQLLWAHMICLIFAQIAIGVHHYISRGGGGVRKFYKKNSLPNIWKKKKSHSQTWKEQKVTPKHGKKKKTPSGPKRHFFFFFKLEKKIHLQR